MRSGNAWPAALLLAAGCRVGAVPEREPGVRMPDSWTAGAEGEMSRSPWWRDLAQPDLASAVEEALLANRDLAAAAARVEAALARARIAGADRLPGLSGTVGRTRNKSIFVGVPLPDTITNTWTASLDLSWELDLWGRLAAGHDAARGEADAALADARAARHSIAARTAQAWLAWSEAGLQVELARRTAASYRSSADLLMERYEDGLTSPLDVRLAEANAAQAEALLAELGDQEQRAARGLEVLLGRTPHSGDLGTLALGEPPPPVPTGLPAELLERRPDLVAQAARLRAQDARLEQARASLLPALSLTASGGRTSDEVGDLLDGDFTIWSLAGNLTQPIFQGGRLRARVSAEEARSLEVLATYEGAVLQALSEVEVALAAERAFGQVEERQDAARTSARAARELAEDSYARGLVPWLEVLEAQRREFDSESGWLSARRRRLAARVDLHLALGGDFEEQR